MEVFYAAHLNRTPVEIDPIRMCRLLVGLRDISVLGVVDWMPSTPLVVHIETAPASPAVCAGCATEAVTRGRRQVTLTDLPAFGRQTRLVAQAPLALPEQSVCARVVDRDRARYRHATVEAHRPCRTVGDVPGRMSRAHRVGGRLRSGVCMAHGQ